MEPYYEDDAVTARLPRAAWRKACSTSGVHLTGIRTRRNFLVTTPRQWGANQGYQGHQHQAGVFLGEGVLRSPPSTLIGFADPEWPRGKQPAFSCPESGMNERTNAEWNALVRERIGKPCECGGKVRVELITRCVHYAGIVCAACSRHGGWLPAPPKSHAVAWHRKRDAEASVPVQGTIV
jgi:hypothetical protein